MTIIKLDNPITDTYKEFKSFVRSPDFPWFWESSSTYGEEREGHNDHGYYTHAFLKKPGQSDLRGVKWFSQATSSYIDHAHQVAFEIFEQNNIDAQVIYRISANCEHPTQDGLPDLPHYDHSFPHENILIYLNDPHEGYTVVEEEKYLGKEDEVILFNGLHYNFPPIKDRRLVIVITFLR